MAVRSAAAALLLLACGARAVPTHTVNLADKLDRHHRHQYRRPQINLARTDLHVPAAAAEADWESCGGPDDSVTIREISVVPPFADGTTSTITFHAGKTLFCSAAGTHIGAEWLTALTTEAGCSYCS